MSTPRRTQTLYATIWRWHFYAGLFVIPFVLLLATTGAAYLFKPQVERWEERAFQGLPTTGASTPQARVDAALAAFPGARFDSYRLPERTGDATMIHLLLPESHSTRDVFVSPQGKVLGNIPPDTRIMEWNKRIHGQLLLGPRGSWLVELAASWAIVLVLSGLYLWWPRGRGLAGVVWPRIRSGARVMLRDLHAVTGIWISGLVLVLLVTGLPWAGLWGSTFKAARTEMGWIKGEQNWTVGGEPPSPNGKGHTGHGDTAPMQITPMPTPTAATAAATVGLDEIVIKARQENLAFPVFVTPPGTETMSGVGAMAWTVRSDAQNRPLRATITYDMTSGRETSREAFADSHIIDRAVGYGIAWHEGQLFGWINQLIGVLTAIGLIVIAISGFILWRRRKPQETLGAPPSPQLPSRMGGVVAIVLVLAALLPLLAASLIALCLFERLALPHLPRLAIWLGVPAYRHGSFDGARMRGHTPNL